MQLTAAAWACSRAAFASGDRPSPPNQPPPPPPLGSPRSRRASALRRISSAAGLGPVGGT